MFSKIGFRDFTACKMPSSAKWLATWLLALLVVLPLTGCNQYYVGEGSYPAERVRHPAGPQAQVQFNNVGILDASIAGKIAVERTGARRNPTGTLNAWAMLRNRTDYEIQVEGRVQFFDQSKAPVEGPTAWQRMVLPPQGIQTYAENSTGVSNIYFYFIEIREGR